MRVISGSFKGKRLFGGSNYDIRPTTDRIKENIFNILQDLIFDREALDLFSGSGNLGIEALSRGAKQVTFVDTAYNSLSLLKRNLEHLGILPAYYKLVQKDVIDFCRTTQYTYDLIFADPPFIYPGLQELVACITAKGVLREKGVLIVEHEITNPIDSGSAGFTFIKQKKYGRSLISFIMRQNNGN